MLSSLACANSFIQAAKQDHVSITPLKLQKLIYLLYAKYYHETNTPLFAENFERWTYGPVVSRVYEAFKHYGGDPIEDFAREYDGKTYVMEMDDDLRNCFNNVWRTFGGWDGKQLSTLTHQQDSAWWKVNDDFMRANSSSSANGKNTFFLRLEDIYQDGKTLFDSK